jgi:NADP-dependent 3-hydroxy acid dehydrogenase YdfG
VPAAVRVTCQAADVTASGGQAVVVGASSGIGSAIAVELAALGFDLSLWGRDLARLEAAATACAEVGPTGRPLQVDVTDRTALAGAVETVTSQGPLSVLVWAAGLFDWAPADQADTQTWDRLLDVNLASAAAATRLALPALVEAAPSSLVFLGSSASRRTFADNAAYVASKHGVAGLAGAVFLDVRDRGVKVSLVSPGLVAAGAAMQSPAGRRPHQLLQPSDVAAAVRFVVTFPDTGCPTEITLQPQLDPER